MRATIALQKSIAAGAEFVLELHYDGVINDKMCGFYRSEYKDATTGEPCVTISTQFEAVDARRAFPCWDEPAVKATYQVSIVALKGITVLSNTAEASREPATAEQCKRAGIANAADAEIVHFGKTMKMSTYLVAWVIGEFDFVEKKTTKLSGAPLTLRIYASKGKAHLCTYALEHQERAIKEHQLFFGEDFPGGAAHDKIDCVALTHFAAGAMENHGLVTYRETALLCKNDGIPASDAAAKERVGLVISHELGHSFFGNKTTMAWWNGLWLNEAFTSFVEKLNCATVRPEFENSVLDNMVHDAERAMELDCLLSTHAVEVPIENAEQVDEVFDVISYLKGQSVIRMTNEFIGGVENLSKGLRNYITKYAYANATTDQLFECLGESSGEPRLPEILHNWIYAPGYPLITVQKPVKRADGKWVLPLSQRRLLAGKVDSSSSSSDADADATVWKIPLRVKARSGTKTVLMETREFDFPIDDANDVEGAGGAAFIVNGDRMAFARVNYTDTSLFKNFDPKLLSAMDRAALVLDACALAQLGVQGATAVSALELASNFAAAGESNSTAWSAIATVDGEIKSKLLAGQPADIKAKYNAHMGKVYEAMFTQLGVAPTDKDSHRTSGMRATVFGRAAANKVPAAVSAALELFDKAVSAGATTDTTKNPVPADLRGAAYMAALRERGKSALDAIIDMHRAAESVDATEAQRIVRVICAGDTAELVQQGLDYAMASVKPQDAFIAIVVAAMSEHSGPYRKLMLEQFATLQARFPGMIIGRVVKAVENCGDLALGTELLALIDKLPEIEKGAIYRSAQQGVDGQKVLMAWRTREAPALVSFLQALK